MFKPTLLIDFDETITKTRGYSSPPDSDAISAINRLKDYFHIVIYSCRANIEINGVSEVVLLESYLKEHNVPYDEIHTHKPTFYALIDDRSSNPLIEGWDTIATRLLETLD